MTELLENSDNTNESAVVSESPANEATISLAVAQSLADALQKIESYTPTVWVDNESPDIDAAHLNKAEQAITRVTTAMNSAVDVIKDLQSQVNTTNNNLSKVLQYVHSSADVFDFNDWQTLPGYHRVTDNTTYKNAPPGLKVDHSVIEVIRPKNSDVLSMTIYPYSTRENHSIWYKSGSKHEWVSLSWDVYATKSDLIQDGIYDVTTDSNGVVAINSVVAGVTVDRFAGAYFYNDAVEANVLTRIHLYKKNVYAIAINPDSSKKYANTAMKIHVWYRKS